VGALLRVFFQLLLSKGLPYQLGRQRGAVDIGVLIIFVVGFLGVIEEGRNVLLLVRKLSHEPFQKFVEITRQIDSLTFAENALGVFRKEILFLEPKLFEKKIKRPLFKQSGYFMSGGIEDEPFSLK